MHKYIDYTKFYKPKFDEQPFPWRKQRSARRGSHVDYTKFYKPKGDTEFLFSRRQQPRTSRVYIDYHECYAKVHGLQHQTERQS